MKTCVTCHVSKPLAEYNVRRSAPDGRQPRCRECCKAWYQANREAHMKTVRQRNKEARRVLREWLARFLEDNPCVDCGESDIRCLEFDHRPGEVKRKEVALMLAQPSSFASIQAEIAKCDVVCANCHRRRTSERAGFWKEAVQREVETSRTAVAAARLSGLFPAAS